MIVELKRLLEICANESLKVDLGLPFRATLTRPLVTGNSRRDGKPKIKTSITLTLFKLLHVVFFFLSSLPPIIFMFNIE